MIQSSATLTASEGDYGTATVGNDTQDGGLFWSVPIPTGFSTLTRAVLVTVPVETGTVRWNVATSFAADGEARTANADSIAATDTSATAAQILELDVSTAFTGIAALDILGFRFNREGSHANDTITTFHVMGLLLEFS